MKAIRIILIAALATIAGCSPKIVERVSVEYRDSVRVDIRERIVHDTLRILIPVESEKIVTPSDSSHIETSFAVSEAVMKDGMLHHSIWNKPRAMEVPVAIPVKDTTEFHHTLSVNETEKEKTVYVEKKLSHVQKFKIGSFWWLLLSTLILGAWTFRKPLLSLIRL